VADWDVANRLQSLQFEDRNRGCLAIADKASPHLRSDGHTMHPRSFGNAAGEAPRVKVEDFHLRSVGYVQAAGGFIDAEVVPAALARDGNLFGDGISAGRDGN
jgi:hypothetical protein